ncbi:MAG: anti-sigma-factor antagonist [Solirubrobacterales bacterium]|nr:anti-sigma-factor antagonist [Solirubrobacterales bacterium]
MTESSQQIPPFYVDLDRSGGTLTVIPNGELDIATVPRLADALATAERSYGRLVLDLRGLSFIDSSGLRLVLMEVERAAGEGHAVEVIPGDERVQRIFRLTGADRIVPFAEM